MVNVQCLTVIGYWLTVIGYWLTVIVFDICVIREICVKSVTKNADVRCCA